MTNSPAKIKYLVDTNVLIGFSLWKPISLNFNADFWKKFSEALVDEKWVLLDVVSSEVKFDSDLMKWCKEQKDKGVIKKISDVDKNRAVEINNDHKMIDSITGKSTVDTYLVAYAEANGLGVFSRESFRKDSTELYKIPDVCQILKIKQTNKPKIFLKEIGFN
jgi:Domain of unknown function (DUF4411)